MWYAVLLILSRATVLVDGAAVGSDQHQVGWLGPLEDDPVPKQPHVVGLLSVAAGDVAVAELTPAQRPEQAVGGR